MSGRIRAFIAIELPPAVRECLSSIIDGLQPGRHPYVKWVRAGSIHLTLKFLGDIDAEQVPQISQSVARASERHSPFALSIGGLGVFPNPQRPQVVWVAVAGEVERLQWLQGDIEAAMADMGFAREQRRFTPHLTLGRLRERASPAERKEIGRLIAEGGGGADTAFQVSEVSLMRSTLQPSGAVYSRLATAQLKPA